MRINYRAVLKNKETLEYLGFCEQKGFVYSEYLGDGQYRIVCLHNGKANELIRFSGLRPDQLNKKEEDAR